MTHAVSQVTKLSYKVVEKSSCHQFSVMRVGSKGKSSLLNMVVEDSCVGQLGIKRNDLVAPHV